MENKTNKRTVILSISILGILTFFIAIFYRITFFYAHDIPCSDLLKNTIFLIVNALNGLVGVWIPFGDNVIFSEFTFGRGSYVWFDYCSVFSILASLVGYIGLIMNRTWGLNIFKYNQIFSISVSILYSIYDKEILFNPLQCNRKITMSQNRKIVMYNFRKITMS